MSPSPAKLRVAGTWTGTVEVPDLATWSVESLRAEIARRAGFEAHSIKLICAGRTLKDRDQSEASKAQGSGENSLQSVGVGPNSKLLVTRVSISQVQEIIAANERSERLTRLRAAAEAMAGRSGEESGPYDIHLENQNGEKLAFDSEDDRRALVMGLMLHSKGRGLLEKGKLAEAQEVLTMAEEAFGLCNKRHLEAVDNVAMLQLDVVWCLFLLGDIARLAVARERLAQARDGLRRSHGPNLERLRTLQGGFCPELATYVRLELLEGVVAFHSANFGPARESLTSAKKKIEQLQVSDAHLVQLAAMGFSTREACCALRVSGQEVSRAVDFAVAQRRKRAEKAEEDRRRRTERREQKAYGRTPAGRLVDVRKLAELRSLGYDRWLAAESLRQTENKSREALEALLDPEAQTALQIAVSARGKPKRGHADDSAVAFLASMGYETSQARRALRASGNNESEAVERLLRGDFPAEKDKAGTSQESSGASRSPAGSTAATQEQPGGVQLGDDTVVRDEVGSDDGEGDEDNEGPKETRDVEMEAEIAEGVSGDPFRDYDVNVDREGEAIAEYLARLESAS